MPRRPSRCLAAACAAVVLFAATPAVAQDDDDSSLDDIPHVTMVGTARAEVAPDLATITLGVTIEKPTAAAAAAETAKTAAAVIDAAKAQGVAAADISTLSLTLTQTFDDVRDKDGRFVGRKPRGFEADTTFAIKLRDLARAGGMAEALIAKGANRFDGIGFSVEHPEPILQRLIGDAVREARAEAAAATQAAGSRLGRVLRIERPNEDAPQEPVVRHARLAAAAPAAMPIEAGTMIFSTTVAVSWAVDAN